MFYRRILQYLIVGMSGLLIAGIALPVQAGASPGRVPERAFAAAPLEHIVTNIVLNPSPPNIVKTGENVSYTLSYKTNQAGGVRIFVHPYTMGGLVSDSSVSPSPVLPTGTGSASGTFTVTTGSAVVDRLLIEITNADATELLQSFTIPVYFLFSDEENLVHSINKAPPVANVIRNDQMLSLQYSFEIGEAGGAHIDVSPMTNGAVTPGFSPSMSAHHPTGPGNETKNISFSIGEHPVDHVRFEVRAADETLLSEFTLPVWVMFTDQATSVSRLLLHNPDVVETGTDVSFSFDYKTDQANVRVVVHPMSLGQVIPDAEFVSDPLAQTAGGDSTGVLNITDDVTVDALHVQVTNPDQSTVIWEEVIPVHLQFGRGSNPVYLPIISR